MKLLDILNEIQIKPKRSIGSGYYKTVYDFKKKPGYIVKTFNPEHSKVIEHEKEASDKFPELFAKIIKVDYQKGYIIQEKLDALGFMKDFKELTQKTNINAEWGTRTRDEYELYDIDFDMVMFVDDTDMNDPLLNKLKQFKSELRKNGLLKDFRPANIGYAPDKKLKLLDL